MNSYFSTEKYKNYTFYRFPKFVITDKRYKNLSSNAKLLYGLILDKAGLSEKNYKHDKDGRIKVFFTNKQVCNLLNIGHNTVTKIFKELESYDLIDRSKQGFGQANINRVMIIRTHFILLYSGHLLRCPQSEYGKYFSIVRLASNHYKAK